MVESDINSGESFADISVIIPAYQAAGTIERALASVSAQSLKPCEVIVVDDGSSDTTYDVAVNYRDKMNGIELKVIKQNNAGAGAARNNAISHAQANYLAFLDADDEWLAEKIEKSLNLIQNKNNLLVAHNGWIVINGQESFLDIASRFNSASEAPFQGLYRQGFISTSSVVTYRKAVLDAGMFDETLAVGQDFDLWLKLLNSPDVKFEIFDQPLTRYHITPNSITSQTEIRLRSTLRIALRHAPALRKHTSFPLASLWFRILAVHWEAMVAYWKNRCFGKCLGTVLKLPVNTILLTTKYLGVRLT